MNNFLAVVGPFVGNFVIWSLITLLPVHPMIIFVLVILTGVLMLCAMTYFLRIVDKNHR